jgi:hypothetical protein
MDTPVDWLRAQLERARTEKEDAEKRLDEVREVMFAAQRRYEACSEMLAVAIAEQGVATERNLEPEEHDSGGVSKDQGSIPDQVEHLLKEHGPMSSAELAGLLKKAGRISTSTNSVNVNLTRYKGRRFLKSEDGKWELMTEVT